MSVGTTRAAVLTAGMRVLAAWAALAAWGTILTARTTVRAVRRTVV